MNLDRLHILDLYVCNNNNNLCIPCNAELFVRFRTIFVCNFKDFRNHFHIIVTL